MSNVALDKGAYEERFDVPAKQTPLSDTPQPGTSEQADADKSPTAREAAPHIWIVRDGEETFAVDLLHGRCTCGQARCAHMELAKTEDPFAGN